MSKITSKTFGAILDHKYKSQALTKINKIYHKISHETQHTRKTFHMPGLNAGCAGMRISFQSPIRCPVKYDKLYCRQCMGEIKYEQEFFAKRMRTNGFTQYYHMRCWERLYST